MTAKTATAMTMKTMPRRRPSWSVIGRRQPLEQELRKAREHGEVLLVRSVRVAAVRECGDDETASVGQLGMYDLGESVVGVADLALVLRAFRKSAAHEAVLRHLGGAGAS